VLLLRRNELVRTETRLDEVWGERPPATAVKALQGYILRLRRVVGETAIETQPLGYLLRLEQGALDSDRFQGLLERGRALLLGGAVAEAAAAPFV
jgi:DNA-binding SARP family transcriptional activator